MRRMFSKNQIEKIAESVTKTLIGTKLKSGYYLLNEGATEFNFFEDVPEDYNGVALFFSEDPSESISILNYEDGTSFEEARLGASSLYLRSYDNEMTIDPSGVNKLNFASLTHSFNELDATLKQIVDDAIADAEQDGVACTQAQWDVIKALLDKSLYINYNGYSMIKAHTNGMESYGFGNADSNSMSGAELSFFYDAGNENLTAKFLEV